MATERKIDRCNIVSCALGYQYIEGHFTEWCFTHDRELKSVFNKHTHEHQFVIPVEWAEEPAWSDGQGLASYPARKKVTKLRCSCGEEIDR